MKYLSNIQDAKRINVADPNNNFSSDNVEGALSELVVDLSGKADKTQVLTNVPANAKFTDTVYTLETHNRDKHSDINQSLLTSDTVQFAKMGLGTATPNETLDVVGNARIRQENSMKFGGVGASDSAFEITYNATTKSLDFNCLLQKGGYINEG